MIHESAVCKVQYRFYERGKRCSTIPVNKLRLNFVPECMPEYDKKINNESGFYKNSCVNTAVFI